MTWAVSIAQLTHHSVRGGGKNPETSWWVNCAIPTAHVGSLYDLFTSTLFWNLQINVCVLLPLPWASGLPVAIQCAWNLDPSVHWNATGERIVGSQCVSSVFQWSSSGFPVVFQCVPIMQINTGSPLGYHWVLASASVVPVASQCTCGSSGLPVCSNYAN